LSEDKRAELDRIIVECDVSRKNLLELKKKMDDTFARLDRDYVKRRQKAIEELNKA
jgi:hypothetical protein